MEVIKTSTNAMTKKYYRYFPALLCLWVFLFSCTSKTKSVEELILVNQATVSKGQELFEQNCATCHDFNQDGIGPQLGGLTRIVPVDWLRGFINNPTEMIDGGDERSQAIFARYQSYMPAFNYLGEEGIDAIIAYMHQYDAPEASTFIRADSVANPIPEPIPLSDLVARIELVTQVAPSSEEMPRTRIAKLDFEPTSEKLYIVDLRGKMFEILDGNTIPYMDMEALMPNFINKPGLATGFGSFAFHPEFTQNGLLYTTHTEGPGSAQSDFGYADSIKVTLQWVVLEWKTGNPAGTPFQGESRELFRIDMVTGIHGMQEITFNPLAKPGDEDYGLLYIGIGDGGSVGSGYEFIPYGPSQAWGSIFRIDPQGTNSSNGKYGIPDSNPFVGQEDKVEEIFVHGFRNPHRLTWTKKGQKLATNIGQGKVESLYMLQPGEDYGWPVREGIWVIDSKVAINQVFTLPEDEANWGFTYPVAMYDHDEGNAISGGFEYWGANVPKLDGKYLFGDIVRGRLFYVETDKLSYGATVPIYEWQVKIDGVIKSLVELSGTRRVDLRLGRDADGEVYIFTKPDGKVYKIVGID